ncbi:GlxA family transcriptional regulator [Roseomonas sp. 18066]|uniref:GlxA family transcriptional regulator n=1 Tax=Roseomonas sp. 18066 TaxID=2681412 RepID=UPI001F237508|nr:DJ-1/PfpI family protein [Roseomonas sp. 18066]
MLPLYPGVMLLDVAGPAEVFAAASRLAGGDAYRLHFVAAGGGMVVTELGPSLSAEPWETLPEGALDTLLLPGGAGAREAAADPALLDAVRRAAARSRRLASVCLGAFILGAAGLLEGRRATTHWRWCAALQDAHPEVAVQEGPIFVQDGRVWTSAGVTTGIDLALAMVEQDLGHALALQVAQGLVVFLKRPGGQAQLSATLSAQAASHDADFAALLGWMSEHLSADLRVEALAARAGLSPRSFARAFLSRTGQTPARAVERLRLEAAQRLLQEGRLPLGAIAHHCGFGDDERMRRAFQRRTGRAPGRWRGDA